MEKRVEYLSPDKFTFEDLKKIVPKELLPTKKINYIVGGIFILVLIMCCRLLLSTMSSYK